MQETDWKPRENGSPAFVLQSGGAEQDNACVLDSKIFSYT